MVKSSIRADFVMLRLYAVLNQLLVKAFSARGLMVSSSGTLVKRDVMSYDTIMLLSLNEVLRISSANFNVSVIVCSLMDSAFNFFNKPTNTGLLLLNN